MPNDFIVSLKFQIPLDYWFVLIALSHIFSCVLSSPTPKIACKCFVLNSCVHQIRQANQIHIHTHTHI